MQRLREILCVLRGGHTLKLAGKWHMACTRCRKWVDL